ncbi:MAG: ATP-binding protein [Polyangiaceae bacterium]
MEKNSKDDIIGGECARVPYARAQSDGSAAGTRRERDLERRLRFLAEVTDRLASATSGPEIADAVTSIAVPLLADSCWIDLIDESGRMRRAASARAGTESLSELDPAAQTQPEFDRSADDPSSTMIVPLRSGDAVVGAITLSSRRSRRRYTPDDLSFVEDIARRTSQTLDNARVHERAARAVKAREDLLAVVSHDLRNPLNVILGRADMVLSAPPSEDSALRARNATLAIFRSAQRMNRLICDLLDAASIEAGRLSVEPSVHCAASIVFDAIEALEVSGSPAGLHLEAIVARDTHVLCDRGRLLQVFSNLLGNAIKFTPNDGTVTVRVEPHEDKVRFSIEDTGSGIPEDQLPHIFERYWQAKRTARLGTGLGLSIAKGIIEAHGGTIAVFSQIGVGSTFSFTLTRAGSIATDQRDSAREAV